MIGLYGGLFLEDDVGFGVLMRLEINIDHVVGCEEIEYFGSQLSTTPDAKNIPHNTI